MTFDGSWTQPLGEPGAGSSRRRRGDTQRRCRADLRRGAAAGLLSGEGPGTPVLELGAWRAARIQADFALAGLGLSVPAWAGACLGAPPGNFEVAGTLGTVPDVQRLALDAAGLRAEGRVVLNADRSLNRIAFSRVRAGGWLDAPVTVTARGTGRDPAITVSGGRLDLREMPDRAGGRRWRRRCQWWTDQRGARQVTVTQGITMSDVRASSPPKADFRANSPR